MPRIKRINELLQNELAQLISREIQMDTCLITITCVKCSPDLRYAKINVSILPENVSGTALKELRRHSAPFYKELKKKLNLKNIPKFNWIIDGREKYVDEIEKILKKI